MAAVLVRGKGLWGWSVAGWDASSSGDVGNGQSGAESCGGEQLRFTIKSLGQRAWGRNRDDSSAGDMVAPAPDTRVHQNAGEDQQIHQGMSLCGGMQSTTASLRFLLTDEFEESKESIQSHTVGLFFLK